MSRTFYNDNDKKAAAWLGELVARGHVSDGDVDTRSIADLTAADVQDRERVHLFAGIGGWDYALKLAGWPEEVPVWTGSCPCQPFSSAGKGKGVDDERHLWPEMLRLIRECRPPVVFGEQVASKAGRSWLDGVQADLEALGYGVGRADVCAAGIDAPHIRQRLWWVAYRHDQGLEGRQGAAECADQWAPRTDGVVGGLVHAQHGRQAEQEQGEEPRQAGDDRRLGDAEGSGAGLDERRVRSVQREAGFWSDSDLVACRDGKARRVEPGSFPLAHGVSARVGRLRGYGNAIVPQVAAEFIAAFMEATA